MSFRIGHEQARHFYPEPRGGVPTDFARNFATGPTDDTLISGGGTQVPWAVIDNGASPGVDVPITPQSTGVILITAVVVVQNLSTDPAVVGVVQIEAQVGGVSVSAPVAAQFSVNVNGLKPIQIVAETTALPVGTLANIQILATLIEGSALNIVAGSSSIEAQEVSVATG